VHIAKCHSTKSWIMSSYFPMSGFWATVSASTGDNRHNCAPTSTTYRRLGEWGMGKVTPWGKGWHTTIAIAVVQADLRIANIQPISKILSLYNNVHIMNTRDQRQQWKFTTNLDFILLRDKFTVDNVDTRNTHSTVHYRQHTAESQ